MLATNAAPTTMMTITTKTEIARLCLPGSAGVGAGSDDGIADSIREWRSTVVNVRATAHT